MEPGWFDMAMAVPLMSTDRAENELGFVAKHTKQTRPARSLRRTARKRRGRYPYPSRRHAEEADFRIREILTGLGARQ